MTDAEGAKQPRNKRRLPWRRWLRALHRDAGYLAIGLTLIYAISGIAINHIDDWDPNFTPVERSFALPESVEIDSFDPEDPDAALANGRRVLASLGRKEQLEDAYAVDTNSLDITLEHTTLYVDLAARQIREEGQEPRPLLRVANWLHLNRGKKAWTYIADGYAVFLIFLAASGLFMLPGTKGIKGRGAVLALIGAALPVLYVTLSDGP